MRVMAHGKDKEFSDAMCESSIDETMELKHKLQMTGELCQKMAQTLNVDDRKSARTGRTAGDAMDIGVQVSELEFCSTGYNGTDGVVSPTAPSPQSPSNLKMTDAFTSQLSSSSSVSSCSVQLVILNQKVFFLEEENRKCRSQLEEVIEHNNHWQKYDSEREDYVRSMQQQLKTLEERLEAVTTDQHVHHASAATEQQQRDVDQLLMAAKQQRETIEQEKEQLEDEIRKLLLDLHNAHARIKALEAELAEVNSRSHSSQENKEYIDKIQMLEAQVQIFSDDFTSERRDRERAQARCNHLEEELELYKRQFESFQTKICHDAVLERQRAMQMYEQEHEERKRLGLIQIKPRNQGLNHPIEASEYKQQDPIRYPHYVTASNGLPEDTEHAHDRGEDVIDSLPEPREETLMCPNCNSEYPLSRHEDFLDHIEAC